jgi:DNA-binding transcriptional MerR regulator
MQCRDDLQKVKSQLETCKQESSKREPSNPESGKLIAELMKHPKFSKKQQGSGLFKSKSKQRSDSLEDVFSALSVSELNTDKLIQCEDKLQKTNVTLQEYKDQLEKYEEEGVWMSKIIDDLRDENNKLRENMVRLEETKSDLMYESPIYGLDWSKIIELTDNYEMTIEKLQKENENLRSMLN